MAKRKPKRTRFDLAAPVSARVELENVILIASNAKRGKLREDAGATALAINVQTNTSANKKQKIIDVIVRCRLGAGYDKAVQDVLRIEAEYLLRYKVPSFDGLTSARLKAFGELNGIYNAWPYWREFVQSTTARMGFPALVVPVYRPGSVIAQRKQPAKKKKRVAAK